jgi:hypothetical protein
MTRTASGLILAYMKACGFHGWTSLWGVIYMAPGYEEHAALLRHERKHLEQMQRDGKLMYMIKYSYWMVRYGYLDNPYEIEARQAEHFLA